MNCMITGKLHKLGDAVGNSKARIDVDTHRDDGVHIIIHYSSSSQVQEIFLTPLQAKQLHAVLGVTIKR